MSLLEQVEEQVKLDLDRWQADAFPKKSQAHRRWEPEEFAADLASIRNISK